MFLVLRVLPEVKVASSFMCLHCSCCLVNQVLGDTLLTNRKVCLFSRIHNPNSIDRKLAWSFLQDNLNEEKTIEVNLCIFWILDLDLKELLWLTAVFWTHTNRFHCFTSCCNMWASHVWIFSHQSTNKTKQRTWEMALLCQTPWSFYQTALYASLFISNLKSLPSVCFLAYDL